MTEDRAVYETQFEGDIRIFVNYNKNAFEVKEVEAPRACPWNSAPSGTIKLCSSSERDCSV